MKVILFCATEMVGQGVLRECLLDHGVQRVLSVVRMTAGQEDSKLTEMVHKDFLTISPLSNLRFLITKPASFALV